MVTQNEALTDFTETEEITADGRRITFPQYSKWIDQEGRFFVVLDQWHGLKEFTDILNLKTEQKLRRPTSELQRLVNEGKLKRYY